MMNMQAGTRMNPSIAARLVARRGDSVVMRGSHRSPEGYSNGIWKGRSGNTSSKNVAYDER